ncbi:MAG TPA: SGNH/GDSL hydrolase family protein [Chitinophagaceae bacterium]|nr:SGNH/GDSL hydrolase family protein [Chitinophagaceae bacterium]
MKKANIFLIFLLLVLSLSLNSIAQKAKFVYTSAGELNVIGRIMPVKSGYHRLDTSAYPDIPAVVKRLLTNSAGMAIVFRTNSTAISAKWCVSAAAQLSNLTPIANKGMDLYIKHNGKWQFAGVARPNKQCSEYVMASNMDSSMKECLVYLPLYDEVMNPQIGVEEGAAITPMDNPFRRKILIYGSSILQGASASRPGLAYPARLSRNMGLYFLNLGLSGSAKMEKTVADMVNDVEADAYILDCVPNSSPEQINERTAYLVRSISQRHPGKPIVIMQSIIREGGYFNQVVGRRVKEQNENIAIQYEALKKAGVKDLYFIKADKMLGSDHEGSVDGIHPNDLGFDRMIQEIEPALRKIFRKYGIR